MLKMDSFALGLRNAVKIIEDKRIDEFIDNRYRSYKSGIGAKILDKKSSFEELSKYALNNNNIIVESGRQEYLESLVNNIIFGD